MFSQWLASEAGFFTYCLVVGTLLGFVLRAVFPTDTREWIYDELTKFALQVLLPVHLFGTVAKQESVGNLDFVIWLGAGGALSCFAILLTTHFVSKLPQFRRSYDPHFKFIASTFAGGGRAVVLLAAVLPAAHPVLDGLLDERIQGQGGPLDALAIFDTGYWLFYTTFIYGFFMKPSFPREGGAAEAPDLNLSGNLVVLLVTGVAFALQMLQIRIGNIVGVENLNDIRLYLAAGIVIFSSAAVALATRFGNWLPVFHAMGFVLLMRLVGLTVVFLGALLLVPGAWQVLLLPMLVMLIAPPSSWIAQMIHAKGASSAQREQAASLNLAWNVLMYATIAILVAYQIAGLGQ